MQNASYEQKDPLLIFKLESVKLFDAMVDKINNQTVSVLMRGQIPVQQPEQVREAEPEPAPRQEKYVESREDLTDPNQEAAARQDTREPQKQQPVVAEKLPGRNDLVLAVAERNLRTVTDADYKSVFAVTRESLYDETATAETAEEEDTIIAEHPVGGRDDYADTAGGES